MEDEGYLSFGERKVAPLSQSRRTAAMGMVQRALESGAPKAIAFQVAVVKKAAESDDLGLMSLGFKASEAILDRFGGKAAQEIRVGETEQRPIIFSDKLRVLNAGLEAALKDKESPVEAFERKVTDHMVDTAGVEI